MKKKIKKVAKPDYKSLTPLNFYSAETMLKDKRGAGKSKWTKVSLDFEIKTGVIVTQTLARELYDLVKRYYSYESTINSIFTADFKLNKAEMRTELESNPDWRTV